MAECIHDSKMGTETPRTPGIWRHLDEEANMWSLYPVEVAETIFAAFANGEESVQWADTTARKRKRESDDVNSCSTVTHRVDFERMKDVDGGTGLELDIKIVHSFISNLNYTPSDDPVETGVWWKHDSGKWHCYAVQALQVIWQAWRRREHFRTLKKVLTRRYPQGVKYIVNLIEMTQTNPVTGHRRPIRIISDARMPSEPPVPFGNRNLTVVSLSSILLQDGLQRLMSLELVQLSVYNMVLEPYKIEGVELNKHLKYEGQQEYQKFLEIFETIVRRVPGCCGQLLRLRSLAMDSREESFRIPSWDKQSILKHVFFLAPELELETILKNGLDSTTPRYFNDHFALTSDYYKLLSDDWERLKLVVFLVMAPTYPDKPSRMTNTIPVADVNHQLPVALLTIRNLTHPDSAVHDSGQSGATGSIDCASPNESLQVVCSTTSNLELANVNFSEHLEQRILMPSRSKKDMLLLFKLYNPEDEQLRYVGGLVVKSAEKPTEILDWLRERAGFAPNVEIRLYKESSHRIDQNCTFLKSQLADGDVVLYDHVLTGEDHGHHRLPAFWQHVSDRQVLNFRRLAKPDQDEFSLEFSPQNTYTDVVEKVALHLGLEDDTRLQLRFNDCFLQEPKPLPLDSSCFCMTLADAYKQTSCILYFEVLESAPPESHGSKTLTVAFHNAKGDKLSVHEIELPKQSTVSDIIKALRSSVELCNPAANIRIFEVFCNRVSKIHPRNEKVEYVRSSLDRSSRLQWSLRAEEISEEDEDLNPEDLLLHVRHFTCHEDSWNKIDFFGEPFLIVARADDTLAHMKARIKSKLQVPDDEFLEWKFAFLSAGRRDYLQESDIVTSRMSKFSSLGSYDPFHYYLGLEHVNKSPKLTTELPEEKFLLEKSKPGHKAGQTVPSSRLKKWKRKNNNPKPRKQNKLKQNLSPGSTMELETAPMTGGHAIRRPGRLNSCGSPSPGALSGASSLHLGERIYVVEHVDVMVPDPEFHNFDARRTEKDIMTGQVWAIYDDHDGMPRFYGRIIQASCAPFKVELSWLEPDEGRKWWVQSTGLSISCGTYETSKRSEIEQNIGVFSHIVLAKAPTRGLVNIYPRIGEVWAIFSNWDLLHMLGPVPILTPEGQFKQSYEFDIVEVLSDYSSETGVQVVKLVKTKGFKTVFQREGDTKTYPPAELRIFSHSIPAEKMDNHRLGIPRESVELDPASLPML